MSVGESMQQTFSPQNIPLCLPAAIPFPISLALAIADLTPTTMVLPFPEYPINGVMLSVVFCVGCFHLADASEVHLC